MNKVDKKIKLINNYQLKQLLGITEENDLLGIKINRSNQKIERRDYKDRNKIK